MKLPKFGSLVNKTTYFFTSVKSNISRGCAKILENPKWGGGGGKILGGCFGKSRGKGGGHTANPFHGVDMDIFCRNHVHNV